MFHKFLSQTRYHFSRQIGAGSSVTRRFGRKKVAQYSPKIAQNRALLKKKIDQVFFVEYNVIILI
jgi:hypothetical protein